MSLTLLRSIEMIAALAFTKNLETSNLNIKVSPRNKEVH